MLTYFEEFYIGTVVNKTTRRSPMFPIKMWNCYARAMADLDTVNNSLESWHKVFEMDCKKHPTINKIIQQFRLEHKNTEVLYAQLESGDVIIENNPKLISDKKLKKF
jgi:hypothetical protein